MYIILVDLDNTHIYSLQTDCFKREYQSTRIGQNAACSKQFHLRFWFFEYNIGAIREIHFISPEITYTGSNHYILGAFYPFVQISSYHIALYNICQLPHILYTD